MFTHTAPVPLILSLMAFCSLFLLIWGIFSYRRKAARSHELEEKIHWGWGEGSDALLSQYSLTRQDTEKKPFLRYLSRLGSMTTSEQSTEYTRMKINFLRAGFYRPNAVAIFWGVKLLLGISFAIIFIMFRVTFLTVVNPARTIAFALTFTLLGFYLPDLWLAIKIARRKDRISKGLPDVLDLLVVCVEAGMGLDSAINRVAQEMKLTNTELSDELKLYNLELKAGKSRQDALKNLSLRTDIEDINSLATLLIQAEKFGTSVAQALRVYSDSFRTKRYMKAEEIAAKLPLKMIFVVVLCIFPSLFVVIVGPPLIRIFNIFFN